LDPARRMMIARMVARLEKEAQKNGQAQPDPNAPAIEPLADLLTPEQIHALRTGAPTDRLAAFEALPERQQDAVITVMGPGIRQAIYPVAPPALRRKFDLANGPAQVVARDLAEAKVLRAIYGNRQLEEVLDDFWFNHFNVFADKGADRYLVTEYE